MYVIRGGNYIDGNTRLGDHLGSIDLGFEYDFKNVRLLAYRQNIYEAGALYYMANISDGLNGLSLTHTNYSHKGLQWKKIFGRSFSTLKARVESPGRCPDPPDRKTIIIITSTSRAGHTRELESAIPSYAQRNLYKRRVTLRSISVFHK